MNSLVRIRLLIQWILVKDARFGQKEIVFSIGMALHHVYYLKVHSAEPKFDLISGIMTLPLRLLEVLKALYESFFALCITDEI